MFFTMSWNHVLQYGTETAQREHRAVFFDYKTASGYRLYLKPHLCYGIDIEKLTEFGICITVEWLSGLKEFERMFMIFIRMLLHLVSQVCHAFWNKTETKVTKRWNSLVSSLSIFFIMQINVLMRLEFSFISECASATGYRCSEMLNEKILWNLLALQSYWWKTLVIGSAIFGLHAAFGSTSCYSLRWSRMSYSRILIMPHILLGQVNLVHIKSFIIVLYCYCITLSMLAKRPVHLYTSRFFYWKVAKSEEPKICYYWLGGCFLEMAI